MNDRTIAAALGQVAAADAGNVFRDWLRGEIHSLVAQLMAEEVTALCGDTYHPEVGACHRRSGSAKTSLRVDGSLSQFKRPRVRRKTDAGTEEVHLSSLTAVRDADDLRDQILRAVAVGVSSRDQQILRPDATVSRSAVSRAWVIEGRKYVEQLRQRDVTGEAFFCLALDGISLSQDLTAIVALGITLDGRKILLDFEVGASESTAVCNSLLDRLIGRGLAFQGTPLALLDGSKALQNSLLKHFPDAHVQRCLVHKERNIKACLSRRHHGTVQRLLMRLRQVEGETAAREVLSELENFLHKHSRKALESLQEAGDELITLHLLGCPSTVHVSLLTTICIENPFRNVRAKIGRVKRWRAETDQAERWLAYGLLTAERGFRRIRGHKDIYLLLEKMRWPTAAVEASLRSALVPPGRPFGDGLHEPTAS